jgi:hypothetical protein
LKGLLEQKTKPTVSQESDEQLTYEDMMMNIDPMIGMENVTPYQFL